MAERVFSGQTQQLHHFLSTSPWSTAPLEQVLGRTADALVGGEDAVLIVDDMALSKKGKHSVGVKRQHCEVLSRTNSAWTITKADPGGGYTIMRY